MLVALFVVASIGVPIAVALGIVAMGALWYSYGFSNLVMTAVTLFNGATSFPLLAIPLFVVAGAIMNSSGISRRLIAFATAIVGFIRGGLSMVTVVTSMFFAEISGSAVADVAALGTILIPAMKRRGHSKEFAAAVTSSSASLAVIIPPSIPMILYGVMADSSVVQLFVAGIIPGVLGGFLLMLVAYWMARRHDFPVEEAFRLRRVGATATEGAGLAVVAAVLVGGFIYRELSWHALYESLKDGVVQTAVVMLLVATSALLGQYLTQARARSCSRPPSSTSRRTSTSCWRC